jgi:hypothetical protein
MLIILIAASKEVQNKVNRLIKCKEMMTDFSGIEQKL